MTRRQLLHLSSGCPPAGLDNAHELEMGNLLDVPGAKMPTLQLCRSGAQHPDNTTLAPSFITNAVG